MFPSYHKCEKAKDDVASTMSRRSSRSSMTLVNPNSFSIRSPSPPHPSVLKHGPCGQQGVDIATVPRATGIIDKTYPECAVATSALIKHPDDRGTHPRPNPVKNSVRKCPHENLSFKRLQRILDLPGFISSHSGIDAIGATKERKHPESINNNNCCRPSGGLVSYPKSTFKLKSNSERHGWTHHVVGLELQVT